MTKQQSYKSPLTRNYSKFETPSGKYSKTGDANNHSIQYFYAIIQLPKRGYIYDNPVIASASLETEEQEIYDSENELIQEDIKLKLSNRYDYLTKKIDSFSHYNIDNWDGYNSPAISNDTMSSAKEWLDIIYNIFQKDLVLWISPATGGGIQFDLQYDKKELEIEFTNKDNTVEYLKIVNDNEIEEDSIESTKVADIINWLIY